MGRSKQGDGSVIESELVAMCSECRVYVPFRFDGAEWVGNSCPHECERKNGSLRLMRKRRVYICHQCEEEPAFDTLGDLMMHAHEGS